MKVKFLLQKSKQYKNFVDFIIIPNVSFKYIFNAVTYMLSHILEKHPTILLNYT